MATKLKDLKITSTDLVNAGANPDAHIRLFKNKDSVSGEAETPPTPATETLMQKAIAALMGVFGNGNHDGNLTSVTKDAKTFDEEMNRERLRSLTNEAWNMAYALSDSWSSIICDDDLTEDDRRGMMLQSLDEFSATARKAIPNWAAGQLAEKSGAVMKSKAQEAAFDAYWATYAKSDDGAEGETQTTESEPTGDDNGGDNTVGKSHNPKKEETENMKFDKSKMTPEDAATFAEFEKKYGTAEPDASQAASSATDTGDGGVAKGAEAQTQPATDTGAGTAAPDLHPEVKKALDDNKALAAQVEELKKSLEIKDLTVVAKKYEILGKKPEELAPKLYDLKKAGGTAYDDYVALLDEQTTLVEKGGLFGEIGKNTSGGISAGSELNVKAAEIKKANTGMSDAEAFAKAYETYPDLAAQYEQTYRGRV